MAKPKKPTVAVSVEVRDPNGTYPVTLQLIEEVWLTERILAEYVFPDLRAARIRIDVSTVTIQGDVLLPPVFRLDASQYAVRLCANTRILNTNNDSLAYPHAASKFRCPMVAPLSKQHHTVPMAADIPVILSAIAFDVLTVVGSMADSNGKFTLYYDARFATYADTLAQAQMCTPSVLHGVSIHIHVEPYDIVTSFALPCDIDITPKRSCTLL
eukprot:TRINITY_DN2395_c0_g1_i2.p1 TRINITY_DN2395_c0_g1~~TRINITY_DN2395_c0_g1_i2.p1  ORF type:complete len:213 (+),score=21.27 TRINITY_DN2395_c0_g1_i2:581-1219(+)